MIIPRYPGGKAIIGSQVRRFFPAAYDCPPVYVEPFVGGGSMLMNVISEYIFSEVWINDLDSGVVSVYRCIQYNIDELCKAIESVRPSVDYWNKCKEDDANGHGSLVERAVGKIFLHAGSHGGIGAKAGSAQGGSKQSGKYKIDCRWYPSRLIKIMRRAHRLSANWRVTAIDFESLEIDSHCFVYADPPYVKAGESLYKHSFSMCDHERLSKWISQARTAVISYDHSEIIERMYSNWERTIISMSSGNNPDISKKELVIWKN